MTERREHHPIILRIPAGEQQRDLIDQAAGSVGWSREGFVLDAACRQAEDVVLDQVFFRFDGRGFADFRALRDDPPRPTDGLRRLLLTKAPWE